jgi:hypothetical protein
MVTDGAYEASSASNSAITDAPFGPPRASGVISLATTVIPHGDPRTETALGCIRHGPVAAAFSSMGAQVDSQFAVFKKEPINCATHEQSLHSLT